MYICPYCGAENADNSTFCSLCLGKFGEAGASPGPAAAHAAPAPAAPGQMSPASPPQQPPQLQQPQEYVSPGDYRALTQEMQQQPGAYPDYRDSAYYGAAMQHPEAISAVKIPSSMSRRSTGDIILVVLKYSIIIYFIIGLVNAVLALIFVGAAFGGGEAGFNFGLAVLLLGQAVTTGLAGYWISSRAGERGRGWIYGLSCIAAIIFFWQPLFGLLLTLATAGVYVPIFNIYGLFTAIFLYLPLGAFGGWFAEKRYLG
jgi:hypothetical protein